MTLFLLSIHCKWNNGIIYFRSLRSCHYRSGVSKHIKIPPIQQELKPQESKDEKKTQVHTYILMILYLSIRLVYLTRFDWYREVGLEDVSHIKTGTCLAFSKCGSFLAACTSNKNLTVWRTSNYELTHQSVTPRKASSLTFTSKNQLIVAGTFSVIYSLIQPSQLWFTK